MAMTPGNQAITGGTVLRIPAIQSPDYSPGISGWIIRIDGSAEFNSGTFRGSIEVGSLTGAHFIVNNPATGDIVDVYNSTPELIFAITNQGQAINYNTGFAPSPNPSINMQNAKLLFTDNATPTPHNATISFLAAAVAAAQGAVTILNSNNVSAVGSLQVLSGSADSTKGATVLAGERGHSGSVGISDQQSTSNLFHTFSGSGTTDVNGHLVIATGASFAATDGHVMYDQTGRSGGIWCAACWYDVASGSIGTQWMTTAGPVNSGTVFYRGKIFG